MSVCVCSWYGNRKQHLWCVCVFKYHGIYIIHILNIQHECLLEDCGPLGVHFGKKLFRGFRHTLWSSNMAN